MFAMLRGAWPRVTSTGVGVGAVEAAVRDGTVDPDALARAVAGLVEEAVAAQVDAGCELVGDGHVRWPDPIAAVLDAISTGDVGASGLLARAFRDTSDRAPAAATVAQAIPGPHTLARRSVGATGDGEAVTRQALIHAGQLAGELEALRDAGCSVVVIEEPAAIEVRSATARDGWIQAHRRMTSEAGGLHLMLSIAGGDATGLGGAAIGGLPYASVLVDLIAGPDNWYVVRELPAERGVVCAALTASPGMRPGDQSPQLVWAAQYAASMGGRGMERVGLANASSLDALSPAEARAALDALVAAARFAGMTREEALAAGFDERAFGRRPGDR